MPRGSKKHMDINDRTRVQRSLDSLQGGEGERDEVLPQKRPVESLREKARVSRAKRIRELRDGEVRGVRARALLGGLSRRARCRPRRAISGCRAVDRDGGSYSDFLDLPAATRAKAMQMDTVIGRRGDFKCILTLHFPGRGSRSWDCSRSTPAKPSSGTSTGWRPSWGRSSSRGSSGPSWPTAVSSSATSRPSSGAAFPTPGAAGSTTATRSARDRRAAARRTTSSSGGSCPRDRASRPSRPLTWPPCAFTSTTTRGRAWTEKHSTRLSQGSPPQRFARRAGNSPI